MQFAIALLVAILFLQEIGDSKAGAQLAAAALFLTLIPSNLKPSNVIRATAASRPVFYRKVASNTYKSTAYHAANGLVEMSFTFIRTTVFSVVFYFLAGLRPEGFGYFFLMTQLM